MQIKISKPPAYEFIRRMVLAWDPDFTRVTADEGRRIREAEDGEFINLDELE